MKEEINNSLAQNSQEFGTSRVKSIKNAGFLLSREIRWVEEKLLSHEKFYLLNMLNKTKAP